MQNITCINTTKQLKIFKSELVSYYKAIFRIEKIDYCIKNLHVSENFCGKRNFGFINNSLKIFMISKNFNDIYIYLEL